MIASNTTISTALQKVWENFQVGGLFMWPLLICLLTGITVIIFKLLTLRRLQILPADLSQQVDQFEHHVESGAVEPLLEEFEKGKTVLARLAAVAVRHRGRSQADITDAVQTVARHEIPHLNAGMTALDVIIMIAPLLGLLGTASGLASMFAKIDDNTSLSGVTAGIHEALHATIFGLGITVMGIIAQSYFNRRIDVLTTQLELLLGKLVHVCHKARPPRN